MTVGRIILCTKCDRDWDVIEIPREYIDPRRFVCGECLRDTSGQLTLDDAPRTETRTYDPNLAAFPEGF